MKTLILSRHGHTEYLAKAPGSKFANDSKLDQVGIKQCEVLCEYLQSRSIDLVATSLLARSREAGKIVSEAIKVPLITTSDLNEYHLDEDGFGVETFEHGAARVHSFLSETIKWTNAALVVSHQSILRTFIQIMINLRYSETSSYFKAPGNTLVLRYDPAKGDEQWTIIENLDLQTS